MTLGQISEYSVLPCYSYLNALWGSFLLGAKQDVYVPTAADIPSARVTQRSSVLLKGFWKWLRSDAVIGLPEMCQFWFKPTSTVQKGLQCGLCGQRFRRLADCRHGVMDAPVRYFFGDRLPCGALERWGVGWGWKPWLLPGVYLCEGSSCSTRAQLGSQVAVGTNQVQICWISEVFLKWPPTLTFLMMIFLMWLSLSSWFHLGGLLFTFTWIYFLETSTIQSLFCRCLKDGRVPRVQDLNIWRETWTSLDCNFQLKLI